MALPSALACYEQVEALLHQWPLVALDFDGTLAPVADRPEHAVLSPSVRATLATLASVQTVAVITGRALADVKARVGLDSVVYAGCHGYEIEGLGAHYEHEPARAFIARLATVADAIEAELDIDGAFVERKRYSVSVHFRRVASRELDRVEHAVERALARDGAGLRRGGGNRIIEVRPDLDWHKGKSLDWLCGHFGKDNALYLGDDVTDEDAFASPRALGVVVGAVGRPTAATLCLAHPGEVHQLLSRLVASSSS